MIKRLIAICFVTFCMLLNLKAQFTYGTTGLLNMPTADMQRDKTCMIGAGFLEKHTTPTRWTYNTYNYYLNVTLFPWLEVAYAFTLQKAVEKDIVYGEGFWDPSKYGRFVNQDRNFSIRLRLWKEGWWKKWTPQIVLGANDALNNSWSEGSKIEMSSSMANGFYSRYYIASTKHVDWKGQWGFHMAYVYNKRRDYPLNGPCFGINYYPCFHTPLNLMAEYDSKSINVGASYSIWKEHINIVGELNRCKYLSVGMYFKINL